MNVIVERDTLSAESLKSVIGQQSLVVETIDAARRHLTEHPDTDVVVIGVDIDITAATTFAETFRLTHPATGVILVRRRVDTSVLTEALHAGMREVVEERDLAGLGRAVERAKGVAQAIRGQSGQDRATTRRSRGRVVTVFSAKGGCGKTTVATNLGAALADGGAHEVCVLDLDLAFGDVAIVLQLFPAATILDAVPMQAHLDDSALQQLVTPHSPGLSALVAPVQPDAKESIPASLVSDLIEALAYRYDYVIVDTPPALDDPVLAAFDHSDVVLLLATLDIPALKNLKITLETLQMIEFPKDRWQIVLNRADSKVGLTVQESEKTLKTHIAAQIPSSRDVPASINAGDLLVIKNPKHPVSRAIHDIATHLVPAPAAANAPAQQAPAASEADAAPRGGLLRRRRG